MLPDTIIKALVDYARGARLGGPRKWKIRKLRRSHGPTAIRLYMPFYLGEYGRYPTFEAAFKAAEAIELRAFADRKRNG